MDELEETDIARPAVDFERDVTGREIGHGLAVLRQREEVQPDEIGGPERFDLRLRGLSRPEPGCGGQNNKPRDHDSAGEPRGHGRMILLRRKCEV